MIDQSHQGHLHRGFDARRPTPPSPPFARGGNKARLRPSSRNETGIIARRCQSQVFAAPASPSRLPEMRLGRSLALLAARNAARQEARPPSVAQWHLRCDPVAVPAVTVLLTSSKLDAEPLLRGPCPEKPACPAPEAPPAVPSAQHRWWHPIAPAPVPQGRQPRLGSWNRRNSCSRPRRGRYR